MQGLYSQGFELNEIAEKLSIKKDTLQKAVKRRRIVLIAPQDQEEEFNATIKSERIKEDDKQALGKACSNVIERVLSLKTGMPCNIYFKWSYYLHKKFDIL